LAQAAAQSEFERQTSLSGFSSMAGEPVKLHIYDVSTNPTVGKINETLSVVGTGGFHGAVEVYGTEYSYGFVQDGTGIFSNAPKGCLIHHYRESLDIGPQRPKRKCRSLLKK